MLKLDVAGGPSGRDSWRHFPPVEVVALPVPPPHTSIPWLIHEPAPPRDFFVVAPHAMYPLALAFFACAVAPLAPSRALHMTPPALFACAVAPLAPSRALHMTP